MFEFTESIVMTAPATAAWEVLKDFEAWWKPSNPGHVRMEVRSHGQPIGVGTEVAFEEYVAGIRGSAEGVITRWTPGKEVAWKGTAGYRHLGFRFRVREGVSWRLESHGQESKLSAHVWAEFPSTIVGRILEWYAKAVLNAVQRDREHTRRELEYLKNFIDKRGQTRMALRAKCLY